MNRTLLIIKHRILSTSAGKKLRRFKYRAGFTRKNAVKQAVASGFSPTEELISDMMNEALEHDVTFKEFFWYRFNERSVGERRQIIPIWETAGRYIEVFNDYRKADLFYDKGKTYDRFKRFYGRKLMTLHRFGKQEKEEFIDFFRNAGRVVIKPRDAAEGRGVRIFNDSTEAEKVFETVKHGYRHGAVVEEVIEQDERMACLHPSSINTIRIVTIRLGGDEVVVMPPVMRVGTNGSIVDNAGSGGILCELDENGVIIATCNEKGQSFEYHPTTHEKMIGFQVPDIAKAIGFAKQLSAVYPEVPYVGWDIALSKEGYVMVEGNSDSAFGAWQNCGFTLENNFRTYMDSILDRFKESK